MSDETSDAHARSATIRLENDLPRKIAGSAKKEPCSHLRKCEK